MTSKVSEISKSNRSRHRHRSSALPSSTSSALPSSTSSAPPSSTSSAPPSSTSSALPSSTSLSTSSMILIATMFLIATITCQFAFAAPTDPPPATDRIKTNLTTQEERIKDDLKIEQLKARLRALEQRPGLATNDQIAKVMAATMELLAARMHQPSVTAPAAKATGQAQATAAGNATGDVARDQAITAIDYCSRFLKNFTTEKNNKWNELRDRIFVPMAVLLLLPGAVLAQVKAIVAAGSPVVGQVSPFDGIQRSLIAIFLIPGSYLVVNYSVDLANSIQYTIATEYQRLFNSDMYEDAMCAEIRAFGVRYLPENEGSLQTPPPDMSSINDGPFSKTEGRLWGKLADPCVQMERVPANRDDASMPASTIAARLMMDLSNAGINTAWAILCAFQMAFFYYLFFVGPIMAALWVWPIKQFRDAFPSWIEGVVTLCFWSLFWHTTILLMACFKGTDDTGLFIMSALNFLATASVRYAFDFAGLVRAAGQKAGEMAEKAAKEGGGGGGGGGAGGAGAGARAGSGARGNQGAAGPPPSAPEPATAAGSRAVPMVSVPDGVDLPPPNRPGSSSATNDAVAAAGLGAGLVTIPLSIREAGRPPGSPAVLTSSPPSATDADIPGRNHPNFAGSVFRVRGDSGEVEIWNGRDGYTPVSSLRTGRQLEDGSRELAVWDPKTDSFVISRATGPDGAQHAQFLLSANQSAILAYDASTGTYNPVSIPLVAPPPGASSAATAGAADATLMTLLSVPDARGARTGSARGGNGAGGADARGGAGGGDVPAEMVVMANVVGPSSPAQPLPDRRPGVVAPASGRADEAAESGAVPGVPGAVPGAAPAVPGAPNVVPRGTVVASGGSSGVPGEASTAAPGAGSRGVPVLAMAAVPGSVSSTTGMSAVSGVPQAPGTPAVPAVPGVPAPTLLAQPNLASPAVELLDVQSLPAAPLMPAASVPALPSTVATLYNGIATPDTGLATRSIDITAPGGPVGTPPLSPTLYARSDGDGVLIVPLSAPAMPPGENSRPVQALARVVNMAYADDSVSSPRPLPGTPTYIIPVAPVTPVVLTPPVMQPPQAPVVRARSGMGLPPPPPADVSSMHPAVQAAFPGTTDLAAGHTPPPITLHSPAVAAAPASAPHVTNVPTPSPMTWHTPAVPATRAPLPMNARAVQPPPPPISTHAAAAPALHATPMSLHAAAAPALHATPMSAPVGPPISVPVPTAPNFTGRSDLSRGRETSPEMGGAAQIPHVVRPREVAESQSTVEITRERTFLLKLEKIANAHAPVDVASPMPTAPTPVLHSPAASMATAPIPTRHVPHGSGPATRVVPLPATPLFRSEPGSAGAASLFQAKGSGNCHAPRDCEERSEQAHH